MPGQFFSPEGDLEEHFITNHWLIDQYIGDTLWGWGRNTSGLFGANNTISRTTPIQEFTSSTNWAQVAQGIVGLGNCHSCAIKTDGSLWCWGDNAVGQLGVNDTRIRSTPVQEFTSSNNWKYVFLGSGITAAIKTDGTLWLWGGTLGFNDSILQRSTPSQEATSGTNWKQVVMRRGNRTDYMAIKTDGTLWTWGSNDFGLIADASIPLGNARSTPIRETTSSTNWKFLLSGNDCIHSMAVKTDGSLWGWGNNGTYQITRSTVSSIRIPTRVNYTENDFIKNGFCSSRTTHVIKSDGTLWSWGRDGSGVTYGSTSYVIGGSSAVQESTYSNNWKSVHGASGSSGQESILAIKTDGTLWGWGGNRALSNISHVLIPSISVSSLPNVSTPVQETTLRTNWKQVSGCLGVLTGIEMDTGNLTS